MISRRDLLLAALATPLLGACALRSPRFTSYPFTLGIASGYPTASGIALWTRLAPSPLDGGGMEPVPVAVRWEVAEDEAFARIAARGEAIASPGGAHAVHVEAEGLAPGRWYFYRFMAGDAVSPTGRTRTAPATGNGDARLRAAVACCQQYEQGFFVAHRHIAAESPDLVLFLGDYIYESSWGKDHVRKHHTPEPGDLRAYRDRYAQYKTDADLQACHASAPWVVTWDDHEVENDYAADRSEELDPDFAARRIAAYRAFHEHMPMRRSVLRAGGGMRIYGRVDWGSLAAFHVLDDRQYRSPQACPRPGRGGSAFVTAACRERLDPALTMLGAEQEAWLDASLGATRASWNFITQQTLFAPSGRRNKDGHLIHWTDGWDGYPAARERLVATLARRRPSNPVFLGGDVHAAMSARIHEDLADPRSPVLAAECVATSITSQGFPAMIDGIVKENAHVTYGNSQVRGYALVELERGKAAMSHRAVSTVRDRVASIATVSATTLRSGRFGDAG